MAPSPQKTGKKKENILVIKLGAMGDFIQALGAMKAIREHHKNADITLLTTKPFELLAHDCGYFNKLILDKRPKFFDIMGWMSLCNTLNEGKFDRVYDLQNNDRTSFYFKIMHPKPEWIGVAKGASHRNMSPSRTAGHAFDGHRETLSLAGIKEIELDDLSWMKADISRLGINPPFILIVPGAAPSRPEKRWPPENYAQLAKTLDAMGYQPVIIGGAAEIEAAAAIMRECPSALNLCEKTNFYQIAELGRLADATIGNDTGPVHLIAATGCPCVALFSAHSNPIKHAPRGPHVQILTEGDLKNLDLQRVLDHLRPKTQIKASGTLLH